MNKNDLLSNVGLGVLASLVFFVLMRAAQLNWHWFKWLLSRRSLSRSSGVLTPAVGDDEVVREEQAGAQLLTVSTFVPRAREHVIYVNMQLADSTTGINSDEATDSVDNETMLSDLTAPTSVTECGTPATDLVESTYSSSDSDISTSSSGQCCLDSCANVDEEIGPTSDCDISTSSPGQHCLNISENVVISGNVDDEIGSTTDTDISTSSPGQCCVDISENAGISGNIDEEIGLS